MYIIKRETIDYRNTVELDNYFNGNGIANLFSDDPYNRYYLFGYHSSGVMTSKALELGSIKEKSIMLSNVNATSISITVIQNPDADTPVTVTNVIDITQESAKGLSNIFINVKGNTSNTINIGLSHTTQYGASTPFMRDFYFSVSTSDLFDTAITGLNEVSGRFFQRNTVGDVYLSNTSNILNRYFLIGSVIELQEVDENNARIADTTRKFIITGVSASVYKMIGEKSTDLLTTGTNYILNSISYTPSIGSLIVGSRVKLNNPQKGFSISKEKINKSSGVMSNKLYNTSQNASVKMVIPVSDYDLLSYELAEAESSPTGFLFLEDTFGIKKDISEVLDVYVGGSIFGTVNGFSTSDDFSRGDYKTVSFSVNEFLGRRFQ